MRQIISHQASSGTPRDPGAVNILVVIGGGKSAIVEHPDVWNAHCLIEVDVRDELTIRKPPLRAPRLVKNFTLADGETAGTMFAEGSPQRERIDQLGFVNGATGLGQLRAMGAVAAERLVATEDFKQFILQLLDHVQIITGGRPTLIRLRFLGSGAGATYGGACKVLADHFALQLTAHGVPVALDCDMLGPITFTGLGPRTSRNAAAAAADSIADLHRKGEGRERLITRTVSFVELPPVAHDQRARDAMVRLDEQAQAGSELQQVLRRVEPNQALNGPLGNVTIRQLEFFSELDAENVAATIAEAYHLQIVQAVSRAQPSPALVSEIRRTTETQPLPHLSTEQIAERALEQPPEDTLRELRTPTVAFAARATLIGAQGEEYETDHVQSLFVDCPGTLADAHDRLRLMRSMLQAIRRELDLVGRERVRFEAVYEQVLHRTEKAIDCLSNGWWWSSMERRVTHFLETADELRSTVHTLNEINAWYQALLLVERLVVEEEESLHARLNRLITALDQHRRKGQSNQSPSLVLFRPVNDAFRELLDLDRQTFNRQRQLLSIQAAAVTVEGLATIVSAYPARLERIAIRIVQGAADIVGPCWGGRQPQGESQVIYALPPLSPEFAERLRTLIRSLDPSGITVFGDHCSAGINVLRYRLYRVDQHHELFRGRLSSDLRDAAEESNRPLYFPNGVPAFLANVNGQQ